MTADNHELHQVSYDTKDEISRSRRYRRKLYISFIVWLCIIVITILLLYLPLLNITVIPNATKIIEVVGLVAGIFTVITIFKLITYKATVERGRPTVESRMLGKLFDVTAWLIVFLVILNSVGKLTTLSTIFAAFGGMFLGWALQSPVSGIAAWILVSLKRPFRPGDRILFPTLGLVGDVKEIGLMYTILNQVGGSVGSEEAVGRNILIPNAMLFGQVVINYTVQQESPYILDEVVVRITYDSDWELAEQILISVANEVTKSIIEETGQTPYVRMDMYDYGVFMRLRYMTLVRDRVRISSEITKGIYRKIQKTDKVDIAIPFIYSYRAGKEAKDNIHIGRLVHSPPPSPSIPSNPLSVSRQSDK